MPRIRSLKPSFWDSPNTAQADLAVRLLYMALWNWADDSGRGTANLKELEAFAFPHDDVTALPRRHSSRSSAHTWQSFGHIAAEVQKCYEVTFYRVRCRNYFQIANFQAHQAKHFKPGSNLPGVDEGEIWDLTSDYNDSDEAAALVDDAEVAEVRRHSSRSSAVSCRDLPLDRDRDRDRDRDISRTPVVDERSPEPRRTSRDGSALARTNFANAPKRTAPAIAIADQFAASRQSPPTDTDLIAIGVEITKALDSGINERIIAAGLTEWDKSDSWSPSQIGRFITKAGRASPKPKSTVDDNVTGWLSMQEPDAPQEITG